jgi:AcrR family transcriptional regulator
MAKLKIETEKDALSTEQKILEAARIVFARDGFAGARTREIVAEAGINLALLNYYFRSKEKLFEVVMLEGMQQFARALGSIVNNQELSLTEKVEGIVLNYTEVFLSRPDLPLFVLTAMRKDAQGLEAKLGVKSLLTQSHFMTQLKAVAPKGINPFHFIINIMGLTVFPFMAMPMLKVIGSVDHEQFLKLLQERKKLIPLWIDAALVQTEKIK